MMTTNALREAGKDAVRIVLPRTQVSSDVLLWGVFLATFVTLGELIILTGNAPWPVLLTPLPLLPLALFCFHQWYKWFSFGQIVRVTNDELVITEKSFNLVPRTKRVPLKNVSVKKDTQQSAKAVQELEAR